MGVVACLAQTGLRQRLDRPHQALGIGVLGLVDDGLDRSCFFDLAIVENDDMVGDLRDNRQIMCDIDGGGTFFLDHLLEGFQHLNLGGHVERGRRLVKNEQVRLAAQRHRRHQALQLSARHLVRIACSDVLRIGELQRVIERQCLGIGFSLGLRSVKDRRLCHLLVDQDRRVEGRCRALRKIGDPLATNRSQLLGRHLGDILSQKACLAASEFQPRLAIAECRQRDGGLA